MSDYMTKYGNILRRCSKRRMTVWAQPLIVEFDHWCCENCGKPDGMEVVADRHEWEAMYTSKSGHELWIHMDCTGLLKEHRAKCQCTEDEWMLLTLPFLDATTTRLRIERDLFSNPRMVCQWCSLGEGARVQPEQVPLFGEPEAVGEN